MTNNQIIEQAVQQQFAGDPEKLSMAYHTFEAWRQLGFSVRKGEHAVMCVYLWKKSSRKRSGSDSAETVEIENDDGFFRAKSYLFSSAQVEPSKR